MVGAWERQDFTTLKKIRPDHRKRYEWVAEREQGRLVVDAACGVGYGSKIMADRGLMVRSYDRDPDAIEIAKVHFNHDPNIKYMVGDLYDVQYPQHADAVVCFEAIEHVAHPERVLRRFHGMAPRLYLSVPNERYLPFRGRIEHHFRHYTRPQLDQLLRQNGWIPEEWFGQKDHLSGVEPEVDGRTLVVVASRTDDPMPLAAVSDDGVLDSLILPGKDLPQSVAIVACGASSAEYLGACTRSGGRHAVADETWLVNAAAGTLQGDRMFHMDDLSIQKARADANTNPAAKHMMEWLPTWTAGPIYTPKLYDGYTNLVEYPLEWVLNRTGHCYFQETSPPYAIALAIAMGVPEIQLYGMDYRWTGQVSREKGKSCVEYWVGVAKEKGITVKIPGTSSLLGYDRVRQGLYGYDTEWLTIDLKDDGTWEVGRVDRLPKDVPSALEIEHRYSHDPERERLEVVARDARRLEHLAAELAAQTSQEK